MTQLTLDLPPALYQRLRAEAQRQGKDEHELAQTVLAAHLATMRQEPAIAVPLDPEVQLLLTHMTDTDMLIPSHPTAERAIRRLHRWDEEDAHCATESEEGDGTWDDILRAIDTNRSSYRRLFAETKHPS